MISAIFGLALTTGASRVVRGVRIEHVCGDPRLGSERDLQLGVQIVRTAVEALATAVEEPTLFDPADYSHPMEATRAS